MEYEYCTIKGAVPSKANSYAVGKGANGKPIMYKPAALVDYENAFYMQCSRQYRNLCIKDFFELHVSVYLKSLAQDLDNTLKIILDCLQYTNTINNDNRCIRIVADKFKDAENPRIEFKLITIEHDEGTVNA